MPFPSPNLPQVSKDLISPSLCPSLSKNLGPLELFKQQPPTTPKHRDNRHHHTTNRPSLTQSPSSSSSSSSSSSAAAAVACSSNPMFSSTPFLVSLSLLLSLPLIFLLAPQFLPPSHPPIPISPSDELDDLSLFSHALQNPNPKKPSPKFSHLALDSKSAKPKIAFLFLTNTDLHFAPLWARFFSKANSNLYNIYVHADPSANVTLPPNTPFHGRLVPSKRTYRASATLISATRRLLANAVIDDPANLFFAVLSQSCVPLHSFRYVYRSLFLSPTFDPTRPATESEAELARMGLKPRLRSFIEVLSKSSNLWKRYSARGRFAMMPEVPFEKFRVGSQFFLLTRPHALVVLKDRALWRKFRLPCYREDECYPEEHYFPTLLSMADPDGLTRYTLTRVNWTGTVNGHPYTYRPGEVTAELIHRLRKSEFSESYLFARKFSPDCLKPLLSLANDVIFRD